MSKEDPMNAAKAQTLENLESIQTSLIRCVDAGMIDSGDFRYNEILDLIDEAHLVDNWDDLLELITRSRSLEKDIAAWLARQGRTTVSLSWPKKMG